MSLSHVTRWAVAGVGGTLMALIASAAGSDDRAALPTPEECGRKLAAYDKAFLAEAAVVGVLRTAGVSRSEKNVQLTCGGNRLAIEEVRFPPAFKKPGAADESDPGEIKYEPDGTMHVRSDDKSIYLWADDFSARKVTTIEYRIAPDGRVIDKQEVYHDDVKHPPEDMSLTLPRVRTFWALGRGFSPYVKAVTDVRPGDGGLLRVTADGVSMIQAAGRWTLLVDPANGFLVRQAEFTYPEAKQPTHIVKTAGLRTEGDCVYPERGSFTFYLGGRPVTYETTYVSVRRAKDDALYARVAKAFADRPLPRTDIHDYRVAPTLHKYVDSEGRMAGDEASSGQTTPGSSARSRWRLILLVNLVAVGVLAIVYYLRGRWRRNHGTAGDPAGGATGATEATERAG